MSIRIETYKAGLATGSAIGPFIVEIQRGEFGIDISLDDQPDLLEIENFYQKGAGNFWVAWDDDKLVGTIALIDIGGNEAALRKMFVSPQYRGKGVAIALLETLLQWARSRGLQRISLGTTSRYLAAHRFYEKSGFTEISRTALPATFPVMAVDSKFYRIELAPPT